MKTFHETVSKNVHPCVLPQAVSRRYFTKVKEQGRQDPRSRRDGKITSKIMVKRNPKTTALP